MNNQNILIQANEALMQGNYHKFITYCSEDIRWECVGERTFNGKAELLNYLSSAYKGIIFTAENYIKQKDFVVELGQIVLEKTVNQRRVLTAMSGILRMD